MAKWLAVVLIVGSSGASAQSDENAALPYITRLSTSELANRCASLKAAVGIYAQILSHNPVDGSDEARKRPFEWINTLRLPPNAEIGPEVSAYLELFGPVTVPTLVPNLPIYQEEKAICRAAFSNPDDN